MVAKDVSVGLTYEVLVSDKLVNVKLDSECPYGGWYGTNLSTGHKVRIKTAGRLRKQVVVNADHRSQAEPDNNNKGDNMPTATKPAARAKVSAADRRARRGAAKVTTPAKPAAAKQETAKPAAKPVAKEAAKQPAKPAARKATGTTPRNAKGQIQSRKSAAKPPAPAKPEAAPTTSVDIDALAAQIAAKLINNGTINQEDTVPTHKTTRKISGGKTAKPAAKKAAPKRTRTVAPKAEASNNVIANDDGSVTVILTALKETPNKIQFGQPKGDNNPLITGWYVSKEGIAALDQSDEDDPTMEFTYLPHEGEQPKHSTRWNETNGNESPASSLYLMDGALKSTLGAKAGDTIAADLRIESDTTVSLTLWVA